MFNNIKNNLDYIVILLLIYTIICLKYYKNYYIINVVLSLVVLLILFIFYPRFEGFTNNNNNKIKLLKLEPNYDLSEYYPQGIKVLGVKRDENFKINRKKDIDKYYDYDTLFHNIFLDYYNEKLIIIGPHLYNFYDLFFPAKINGIGRKVELKAGGGDGYTFEKKLFKIIIKIDKSLVSENNLVTISFKNNQVLKFNIKKNNFKCGDRILVTKQKNNKEVWIKDWINYYNTKYNIDTIVIFDNNTEKEMSNKLCKSLNNNISKFIPYNYNFGIPGVHHSGMLQVELMSIAKYQFCKANVLYFNFDIDELLQIPNNKLNKLLLEANNKLNINFLEWSVPVSIKPIGNYSFKDFKYKNKEPSKKGYATKYVTNIDRDKNVELGVHTAEKHFPKKFLNDFFLHYRGLNIDWKVGWGDRQSVKESYNPNIDKLIPI